MLETFLDLFLGGPMGIFQENIKREALAEEIEKYLADNQLSGYPRTLMEKSVTALREPATEAVRNQALEEVAKACDAKAEEYSFRSRWDLVRYVREWQAREDAAAARALKGKGASQGADEFVMVPREPTQAMLAAAIGWREGDPSGDLTGELDMFDRIYRAMLAASPSASPAGSERGR